VFAGVLKGSSKEETSLRASASTHEAVTVETHKQLVAIDGALSELGAVAVPLPADSWAHSYCLRERRIAQLATLDARRRGLCNSFMNVSDDLGHTKMMDGALGHLLGDHRHFWVQGGRHLTSHEKLIGALGLHQMNK
jgi:hypothetical protein